MTEIVSSEENEQEQLKIPELNVELHFSTPIYLIEKPEFIEPVNQVSEEYLEKRHKNNKVNKIYPLMMTDNFYGDERLADFTQFIGSTAWNILEGQGYYMQDKNVVFTEMWTQEHFKQSSMEQHSHGYGSQIVGFYFLDVPKNSSRVLFHDPRIGKYFTDLPEQNNEMATIGSKIINFEPKPGLAIFTNAWLAHSFTRHANSKPLKFVHFNLTVQMSNTNCNLPEAEVI